MKRVPAAPVLLGAVLAVFTVVAASASPPALVLNKCCVQGDELVPESESVYSVLICRDHDTSRANVQDVHPRPLPRFDVNTSASGELSWLSWTENVYDADELLLSNRSFADAIPNTTLVRYGVRPCTSYHQLQVAESWIESYSIFTNGTLFLNLSSLYGHGELSLEPDKYCIDVYRYDDQTSNVILSCPCKKVPCLRKCCPSYQDYVFGKDNKLICNETVNETEDTWRPFHGRDEEPAHLIFNRPLQCKLVDASLPDNPDMLNGKRGSRKTVTVLANGSALLEGVFDWPVESELWCGESIRLEDGERVATAALCKRPTLQVTARLITYASCLVVSAFFLALTLAVYAALPKMRAPPHAKALMCHCAALLVGSVTLAAAQVGVDVGGPACQHVALTIQFCYLAAFFWLSILSYDVSQAFREYKLRHCESTANRTFLWYSIIAWGGPFLVTLTTFINVKLQNKNRLPDSVVPPGIGEKKCWFKDSAAKWAYYNGLLVVLLLINIVLYAMTTARLCGFLRNNAQLTRGESCMHGTSSRLGTDKLRFWLHSRLFLLMGLLWGFAAVSPAFEGTVAEDDVHHFHWFAVDIVNLLRGVVLFYIYCCKCEVVHKLRERAAACGLTWAAPPADGDAPDAHRPRLWSFWMSSGGAPTDARRRPTSLTISPAAADRSRLSTRTTWASAPSRSPSARGQSPSPAITPIAEDGQDPFGERGAGEPGADMHVAEDMHVVVGK